MFLWNFHLLNRLFVLFLFHVMPFLSMIWCILCILKLILIHNMLFLRMELFLFFRHQKCCAWSTILWNLMMIANFNWMLFLLIVMVGGNNAFKILIVLNYSMNKSWILYGWCMSILAFLQLARRLRSILSPHISFNLKRKVWFMMHIVKIPRFGIDLHDKLIVKYYYE